MLLFVVCMLCVCVRMLLYVVYVCVCREMLRIRTVSLHVVCMFCLLGVTLLLFFESPGKPLIIRTIWINSVG